MSQIDLIESYSFSIALCGEKTLKKQLLKKCKYERTMNEIPSLLGIK